MFKGKIPSIIEAKYSSRIFTKITGGKERGTIFNTIRKINLLCCPKIVKKYVKTIELPF